ncbi:MAG: hypothetical protein HN919_10120 [Verrucomicrobia bacterium]|jgi:preprotein translocase subunit SecB|nr:hypothetical protein [Verrucomicrobiota bacterium]
MKLSPLDLCRYFVTEVSCAANSAFDPEKPVEVAMDQLLVETSIQKAEIDSSERVGWSVDLSVSYQANPDQNYPYSYAIKLVGFFSSPSEVPDGLDDERLVRVNGSSMLYGTAREMLRNAMATGPWGEMLIPTISFYESKKDSEEAKKA